MTFEKILEKQAAVLTKMYKAMPEMARKRCFFRCTERGVTYYIFEHELMIPSEFEESGALHTVKIQDVDVPQFSVPRFLEQFYYFGGGAEEYRIPGIPDKKELKEVIKAAGGLRYDPLYQVNYYDQDGFGSCFPLKDERYISVRDLLYIYDFLCETKYNDVDIYVVPSYKFSPYYFKGQYGSGYIMPTIARLNEKIDKSCIINK